MMKSVRAFLTACFMATMLPAVSYGAISPPNHTVSAAEAERDDSIVMIEEEPIIDDSGNVTVTVFVADDVAFPVTMMMKGREGRLSLTVTYDGQSVKMKPGTYRLTKVTDGNGKSWTPALHLPYRRKAGRSILTFINRMMRMAAQ